MGYNSVTGNMRLSSFV